MVESTPIWQNYNLNEIEPTSKAKWFPIQLMEPTDSDF